MNTDIYTYGKNMYGFVYPDSAHPHRCFNLYNQTSDLVEEGREFCEVTKPHHPNGMIVVTP